MKTTRYFEEQVLRKRPYIRREWYEQIVANPLKTEIQQTAESGIGGSFRTLADVLFAW